jgi:putative transcriptional regulator
MYTPLDINRENLTIMGIEFPDLKSLESAANAIGSNMFEGFEPTSKGIEIIRDYSIGKISLTELVAFAKEKVNDRKIWLANYNPDNILQLEPPSTINIKQFINTLGICKMSPFLFYFLLFLKSS